MLFRLVNVAPSIRDLYAPGPRRSVPCACAPVGSNMGFGLEWIET